MKNVLLRAILALCLSYVLIRIGMNGNEDLMYLGYLFLTFIYVSNVICLNALKTRDIGNEEIRDSMRNKLVLARNRLITDYTVSTVVFMIGMMVPASWYRIEIRQYVIVDIPNFVAVLLVLSMIYQISFYRAIHKFQLDIEDCMSIEIADKRFSEWMEKMKQTNKDPLAR